MKDFSPFKWLLGLIAVLFVALIVVAGEGPRIEQDLTKRSAQALEQNGFSWAEVTFNGRDGVLTGTAFDRHERNAARKVVSQIRGVGTMQDRAELLPGISPYTWRASRKEDRIRIKGHVPTKADQQTILGIIKATMPDLQIEDRTKFASGVPPKQNWLGAISFALNQLSHLENGSVLLSDMSLNVAGQAIDQTSYSAISNALTSPLPAGLTLAHQEIAPPRTEFYSLAIQYTGSTVMLSGHVPSELFRKTLTDKVGEEFTGVKIDDAMVLTSGPPKGWGDAALAAIALLSRLEQGNVKMREKDLTIEGTAADAATAAELSKLIRETLPEHYKPVEKIEVRNSKG